MFQAKSKLKTFQITQWVRQGNPMSPKLFTASLEKILKLNWAEKEYEMNY